MTALLKYDAARAALAECKTAEEILSIRDEMEYVKVHARQVQDRALMADALEIQIWAERRLGEVIQQAVKAGLIKSGRPKKRSPVNPTGEEGFTLKEAGITHKLSSKAQRLSSISQRAVQAMVDGMRARVAGGAAIVVDPVGEQQKEARKAKEKADHAARTYDGGKVEDLHTLIASGFRAGAILADPPWHFVTRSDKGEGGSASAHYTTDRRWKDILELPVAQLAAADCTLHMWMVDWCPKLALDIIEAWGFAHKTTAFTWVKLTEGHDGRPREELIGDGDFHFGMGYWTRANPEDCWLATRGSPKRINADVRQLIIHPVMEHSRKPDEVHDRIERLVGGPYLELYARRERNGWVTWGNELAFQMPVDAAGEPITHDEATGDIEPEAQPDDTALAAGEVHRVGEFYADYSLPTPEQLAEPLPAPPQNSGGWQSPLSDIDIPKFLRRGDPDCVVKT